MRDFLPADLRRREYVIRIIKETYERYGFEPLETPAVENIETLLGKYGEEGNQLIFKILKRGEHEKTGEADLALRYDLTVPLARVVAEHGERLPKFFKRYQIQPVWRADRPARGRYREFYQCDVDCTGSRSPVVEAELCAAASDALTALGFNNFTIRLNHRQVLAGVLEKAGVEVEKHGEALVALDKLDKVGREGVAQELKVRGVSHNAAERLLSFFDDRSVTRGAHISARTTGEITQEDINDDVLRRLMTFVSNHEAGASGVDNLRRIVEYAAIYGVADKIKIEPSLARGLSYYTGAIIEISAGKDIGSICGGGRYDNLIGMFSGRDIPACGLSLGLERIILIMTEREMFPVHLLKTPADVMVTIWDESSIKDSLSLAKLLRDANLRVDVYSSPGDKLNKQLKYASAHDIPIVVMQGPDERAHGLIKYKVMSVRHEATAISTALAEELKKWIATERITLEHTDE